MRMGRQILGFAVWLAVVLGAGAVGAAGSIRARDFYAALVRPSWAPPGWLFGPVWTTLYVLMGVAAWLVWRKRGFGGARSALGLFLVQLVLNAAWSWLFFVWRQGGLAFAEILVLWILIASTLVRFGRIQKSAAVLLAPYLAWVTFAAFLCHAVWRLNPGQL